MASRLGVESIPSDRAYLTSALSAQHLRGRLRVGASSEQPRDTRSHWPERVVSARTVGAHRVCAGSFGLCTKYQSDGPGAVSQPPDSAIGANSLHPVGVPAWTPARQRTVATDPRLAGPGQPVADPVLSFRAMLRRRRWLAGLLVLIFTAATLTHREGFRQVSRSQAQVSPLERTGLPLRTTARPAAPSASPQP